MAFYNMLQGDARYTKQLADNYAISDNCHQPGMGGTGLDEILLYFADDIWFQDQNGNLVPPHNQLTFLGGPVDEIENPNPVAGTNNWWTQDGYGGFGNHGSSTGVYGGGSLQQLLGCVATRSGPDRGLSELIETCHQPEL